MVTHKYSTTPLDLSLQNIGRGQCLNIYEPASRLMCHLNTSLLRQSNFVTFSLVPNCTQFSLCRCALVSKRLICVCLFAPELFAFCHLFCMWSAHKSLHVSVCLSSSRASVWGSHGSSGHGVLRLWNGQVQTHLLRQLVRERTSQRLPT